MANYHLAVTEFDAFMFTRVHHPEFQAFIHDVVIGAIEANIGEDVTKIDMKEHSCKDLFTDKMTFSGFQAYLRTTLPVKADLDVFRKPREDGVYDLYRIDLVISKVPPDDGEYLKERNDTYKRIASLFLMVEWINTILVADITEHITWCWFAMVSVPYTPRVTLSYPIMQVNGVKFPAPFDLVHLNWPKLYSLISSDKRRILDKYLEVRDGKLCVIGLGE